MSRDVYPGALELCDDIDNQCPGDEGYGTVDEFCLAGRCITYGEAGNVYVSGNYAYVADEMAGIAIIKIINSP